MCNVLNRTQDGNRAQGGFSLVELSIVLVILGLLVGGILAGQSLIRASELRSVSTEYQRYVSAIAAFRDKYFMLPGDITNATSFWTAGTCPGTSASPATGPATCNGDGNGQIQRTPTGGASNEVYRFWQHLANAGLVEGTFSGVANSTTYNDPESRVGWNVPASKWSKAGWTPLFVGAQDITNTVWFEGAYGHIFYFGASNAGDYTGEPVLKPEEAWNVDTKLDDGKPGTGVVRVRESNVGCHGAGTSNSVALAGTATYTLSSSTIGCPLFLKFGL